jgi:acetyl esterase/lipase
MRRLSILLYLLLSLTATAGAQTAADNALDLSYGVGIAPNITYLRADGEELKLDVVFRRSGEPRPVLLYIHGGGWVGGQKESMFAHFIPWLEMGYSVVNVEYRMGQVALAPGAVEDCRCALRWLIANADTYNLDPQRIVVSGHSAGGHLSLTTALLPASAGLDKRCPVGVPPADSSEPEMPVAAVVNWFGVTDVNDLIEGENAKTYAVQWLGSLPDKEAVAKRVSPMTYVRAGLPPVLTIHGDADPIVPYQHGVDLHEALEAKGGVSRLHTVAGGGHGGFSLEESRSAFAAIRAFLKEQGLLP